MEIGMLTVTVCHSDFDIYTDVLTTFTLRTTYLVHFLLTAQLIIANSSHSLKSCTAVICACMCNEKNDVWRVCDKKDFVTSVCIMIGLLDS